MFRFVLLFILFTAHTVGSAQELSHRDHAIPGNDYFGVSRIELDRDAVLLMGEEASSHQQKIMRIHNSGRLDWAFVATPQDWSNIALTQIKEVYRVGDNHGRTKVQLPHPCIH